MAVFIVLMPPGGTQENNASPTGTEIDMDGGVSRWSVKPTACFDHRLKKMHLRWRCKHSSQHKQMTLANDDQRRSVVCRWR